MDEDAPVNIITDIALFTTESIFVLVLTVIVLRRYLSFKDTDKSVYFATFVGYFVSFATIILMPVDIAVTNYHSCRVNFEREANYSASEAECPRPVNYIPPSALVIVWNIIYWTTYVATWAVYPLLQSYVLSGEFHYRGKLKQAVKENLIYYAVALVLCIIIFVALCIWIGALADALHVATVASNLWGIGVLIALLSYGIIDVPRNFWRTANRHISFKYCLYMLVKYNEDIKTYGEALSKTLKLIKKYEAVMDTSHENRQFLEQILFIVPPEYHFMKKRTQDKINDADDEQIKGTDYSDLVTLNARLKWDMHQYNTAKCLFDETFKEAVNLHDIIRARRGGCSAHIQHSLSPSGSNPNGVVRNAWETLFFDSLEWLWSHISPITLRSVAIVCVVMSLTLVFSEVIFFKWGYLSIYAMLVKPFVKNPALFQIIIFVLISYVCTCAYTAIFKIKLFSYYQMIPHQRTDGNSAVFSAANLTRLVAPLCLNFLHLINFINTSVKSPFLNLMTSDPIQDSVFLYFPMVLVVIAIVNVFNLGNKLLALCKVKSFQFSEDFDDEQIDKGRDLMDKEKEARLNDTTTVQSLCQEDEHESTDSTNNKKDSPSTSNKNSPNKEVTINHSDGEEDMFDARPPDDDFNSKPTPAASSYLTPPNSDQKENNIVDKFVGIFKNIGNSSNTSGGGISLFSPFQKNAAKNEKIEMQPLTANMDQNDNTSRISIDKGNTSSAADPNPQQQPNNKNNANNGNEGESIYVNLGQHIAEREAKAKPKFENNKKNKSKKKTWDDNDDDDDNVNDAFLHKTNYEDTF